MLQKNCHLFGICFRLHHICRKFLKSFVFKIFVCVILNELFLCIESVCSVYFVPIKGCFKTACTLAYYLIVPKLNHEFHIICKLSL